MPKKCILHHDNVDADVEYTGEYMVYNKPNKNATTNCIHNNKKKTKY